MVELGISTFGETTPLADTGEIFKHDERIRQLVAEIELADQVGLDVYGIGEHHREDFAVSAPEIILAAGAVKTKHIRLTSAVTILSSLDSVRVYQQYATIDALSNGRAEIMAGRGSFTESFPLFGYDLRDYEALFDEKIAMLLKIRESKDLNWQGQLTQTVNACPVYPRSVQKDLPIWVATGGNVESTIKIATLGLPIVYAIIGGNPFYFKNLINAYWQVAREAGHDLSQLKVGAHSWGFIAENHDEAVAKYFHPTKMTVDNVARSRPNWREMTYEQYQQAIGPEGAMLVGDPDHVARKLIALIENLKLDRFMLHLPLGSMPHEDVLKAIELFGRRVAPQVRAYFESRPSSRDR